MEDSSLLRLWRHACVYSHVVDLHYNLFCVYVANETKYHCALVARNEKAPRLAELFVSYLINGHYFVVGAAGGGVVSSDDEPELSNLLNSNINEKRNVFDKGLRVVPVPCGTR
jgi:hypothetical protein